MAWNWTLPGWPDFRYDASALEPFEQKFLLSSGEVLGAVHHVSQPEREQLRIELLSEEAMQTSAIEGEILDRLSVQSSLRRHLGLDPDSYPAKPREQGVAEMMVDVYSSFAEARMLIAEENFLNRQVTFPGIWSDWEEDELTGGFHAVIGNPPWDRMKLQQVEWFAERRPEIAMAARAADRKKMINAPEKADDPLAQDYAKASERAEARTRMARKGGDYPMLSGGDVNLYSLYVERAMTVVKKDGLIGLLVPSGIASDKTAANFFKGVATEGRLKTLYDFENGRQGRKGGPFFPDVHRSFKLCALVASPSPTEYAAQCAFFLHDVSDLTEEGIRFALSPDDFARVNPNTGTAPIFRSKRDADLTTAIYGNAVPLVDRSSGTDVTSWPVKCSTMFHMTNDSGLFRTRKELDEQEAAYPLGGNTFGSASGNWRPLCVGRMIHQFEHCAASVEVNEANLHNAALSGAVTKEQRADHKALLLGKFGAISLDYVTRQKAQSTHLNWYIVEQLPVISPEKNLKKYGLERRPPHRSCGKTFLSSPTRRMTWPPSRATWAMSMRLEP